MWSSQTPNSLFKTWACPSTSASTSMLALWSSLRSSSPLPRTISQLLWFMTLSMAPSLPHPRVVLPRPLEASKPFLILILRRLANWNNSSRNIEILIISEGSLAPTTKATTRRRTMRMDTVVDRESISSNNDVAEKLFLSNINFPI